MKKLASIAVAIMITTTPTAVGAQLTHMAGGSDRTFGLEVGKAFIGDSGLKWYTSTVRGRLLAPLGASAHLIADWGVSIAGTDGGTDATFANPEVGIGFRNQEGKTRALLTVVLPFAFGVGDDDASVATGAITDVLWPERYADEVMSINAAVTPSTALGERTQLMADIYLSALVPTGDGDTELFSRYGLGVEHELDTVRLRGALEGLAILSESDLSFGDRTLHRLLLAVDGIGGGPGAFVQIPLDDELEGLDAVVGLTFTF
jgi:hypothetical protein